MSRRFQSSRSGNLPYVSQHGLRATRGYVCAQGVKDVHKPHVFAQGGTETRIVEPGGIVYRVHTFTSSGTFNAFSPGDCEYLVQGGGGGGGGRGDGGGGGGAPYGIAGDNLLNIGTPATDGGLITGGTGGIYIPGQYGGDGGDLGQDGADGVSSYGFTVGGTAGDAIHGQSFIVWENTGTIYGATS